MANTIILPFSELQAELNDEAMIDPNAIIEITENGRYDVARYGYADVDVPQPSGKITITENGTDIDVSEYATADVNVSGGSSDFSTANVTIINNAGDSVSLAIPTCYESTDAPFGLPFISSSTTVVASNESATFKAALYKGYALFSTMGNVGIDNVTTSGDVTYNEEYSVYFITGDCTITIS